MEQPRLTTRYQLNMVRNAKKMGNRNSNTTPPDPVVMQEKTLNGGVSSSEVDFKTRLNKWFQEHTQKEISLMEQLREFNVNEMNENEMQENIDECTAKMQVNLVYQRRLLKTPQCQAIKYTCEWKECTFFSAVERKYYQHVEEHAYTAELNVADSYVCAWDLCDFCIKTHSDFIGHVHFHAYHTKLKVKGESLSMQMKFPSCNYDSRTRNNISDYATSYTCEWKDCVETNFNKVLEFHHHLFSHIVDLFPPGKKSSSNAVCCRWSNCHHSFLTKSEGQSHMSVHNRMKVYACFTCGTMFCSITKYREHHYRQAAKAYCKFQCDQCEKHFPSLTLLKRHQTNHNLPHPCPMCPRKFFTKSRVTAHIHRIHTRVRNFACMQCDHRSFSAHELKQHINQRHNPNNLFRCDERGCEATFKCMVTLKRHLAKHYNIPPKNYECHICQTATKTATELSKHLKLEHQILPPPGFLYYRYTVDTDGTYRLNTYVVEQKNKSQTNKYNQ